MSKARVTVRMDCDEDMLNKPLRWGGKVIGTVVELKPPDQVVVEITDDNALTTIKESMSRRFSMGTRKRRT